FFLQAEDGIRDRNVTGVQTCALPICLLSLAEADLVILPQLDGIKPHIASEIVKEDFQSKRSALRAAHCRQVPERYFVCDPAVCQIGRASCREGVWMSGHAGAVSPSRG